jgi:transcriptional regulator with XRE-family HTH domain
MVTRRSDALKSAQPALETPEGDRFGSCPEVASVGCVEIDALGDASRISDAGDAGCMPVRQSVSAIGGVRSRYLRQRLSDELMAARLGAGLSLREVARRVGVSDHRLARAEHGGPGSLTIDLVARTAAVLGLELAASLHPHGDPVRDRGQLALLARFRPRLGPSLRWRAEVAMPIAGDRRSGDGLIEGVEWAALVEAETRLGDLQLVERRASAKQRDLDADRLVLLVADTRHNREVLRLHPELHDRFPIETRACLRRLGQGLDPGGDCLVLL